MRCVRDGGTSVTRAMKVLCGCWVVLLLDLALLAAIGLPEAVLGVILDESDRYADEQLGRIAREMGFADQLSSVIDRLGR